MGFKSLFLHPWDLWKSCVKYHLAARLAVFPAIHRLSSKVLKSSLNESYQNMQQNIRILKVRCTHMLYPNPRFLDIMLRPEFLKDHNNKHFSKIQSSLVTLKAKIPFSPLPEAPESQEMSTKEALIIRVYLPFLGSLAVCRSVEW